MTTEKKTIPPIIAPKVEGPKHVVMHNTPGKAAPAPAPEPAKTDHIPPASEPQHTARPRTKQETAAQHEALIDENVNRIWGDYAAARGFNSALEDETNSYQKAFRAVILAGIKIGAANV